VRGNKPKPVASNNLKPTLNWFGSLKIAFFNGLPKLFGKIPEKLVQFRLVQTRKNGRLPAGKTGT